MLFSAVVIKCHPSCVKIRFLSSLKYVVYLKLEKGGRNLDVLRCHLSYLCVLGLDDCGWNMQGVVFEGAQEGEEKQERVGTGSGRCAGKLFNQV